MKFTYFLILIILSLQGFPQSNYTDLEYNQVDCDDDILYSESTSSNLIRHIKNKSKNHISFFIDGNCCEKYKPIVRISNDTIFIESNNISNEYCWCDCRYKLELSFNTDKNITQYFIDGNQEFSDLNEFEKYHSNLRQQQLLIKAKIDSFHYALFNLYIDNKPIDFNAKYSLKYVYHDNYYQGLKGTSKLFCEYGDTILTGIEIFKQLVDKRNHKIIDSLTRIRQNDNQYLDSLFFNLQEHYNQIITRKQNILYQKVKNRELDNLFGIIHGYRLMLSFDKTYLLLVSHFETGSDPSYLYQEYYYYEKIK